MIHPFEKLATKPKHAGAICLLGLFTLLLAPYTAFAQIEWPEITRQSKPWTRWWWMGSSVTEKNISALMEEYREAGLGGLEITPIYGVSGYEPQFIDYLSEEWVEMLMYTLQEAEQLGLGIDMATGTGWPFGGPWIQDEDASKYLAYTTHTLKAGERLTESIRYMQEPIVRAVGYNVYGLDTDATHSEGRTPISISAIKDPIAANENLQTLALDQVRFEKPLPLQVLMAYSDQGEVIDLTTKVNDSGRLDWTAPQGEWTLYAVFQGWHGKMVERAAPGGEGLVIDHFSESALQHYLQPFDQALAGQNISSLRAFFNDSYEVDDARGQANFTPNLWAEFEQRQGYDLRDQLPALFGEDSEEKNQRVLSDYRETVSELLLEHFTQPWQQWAAGKGAIIRNQSHGSPANILDLYAAIDIPETEGNEILRFKFATSAAHVTGKPLASAESATWLNEHFISALRDVRAAIDLFFLSGVNHIFYHGTNYSPPQETWPGWLFYAAVHFTPANPFWKDFHALNRYVARCQSFLQAGQADQDVLMYYPIYDYYAERGPELLRHFDGFEEEDESSVHKNAELLQQQGYAFDFISDRQLQAIEVANGLLQTGEIEYQTLVLPHCRFMPLPAWEKLMALVREGATLIVHEQLPASLAGLRADSEQAAFEEMKAEVRFEDPNEAGIREAALGEGKVLMGEDMEALLEYAEIRREAMVDQGLQFVRRKDGNQLYYFLSNGSEEAVEGWIPLQAGAQSVARFDPMLGKSGLAAVRNASPERIEVFVQLSPGESCILQTYDALAAGDPYPYYQPAGEAVELSGNWTITFEEGGPTLPPTVENVTLGSWTELEGEEVKKFSGTARYVLSFPRPAGEADAWRLSLGEVRESATVILNGDTLGTLLGPDYTLTIESGQLQESNRLEVVVTNGMANRIANLDQREVVWKKFYNINFPAWLPENRNEHGLFTAADWQPQASGLLGPVTLTPVKRMEF